MDMERIEELVAQNARLELENKSKLVFLRCTCTYSTFWSLPHSCLFPPSLSLSLPSLSVSLLPLFSLYSLLYCHISQEQIDQLSADLENEREKFSTASEWQQRTVAVTCVHVYSVCCIL